MGDFVQMSEGKKKKLYAKVGGIVDNKQAEGGIFMIVRMICSTLLAVDIGASQASEEGQFKSVESLGCYTNQHSCNISMEMRHLTITVGPEDQQDDQAKIANEE